MAKSWVRYMVAEVFTAVNKDVATILQGQPVTIHGSGIGVVLATAFTPGLFVVGLADQDIPVNNAGAIRTSGQFYMDDWTSVTGTAGLAAKSKYFLSSTAGRLVPTPPSMVGQFVQEVGTSVTDKTLEIHVLQPILL